MPYVQNMSYDAAVSDANNFAYDRMKTDWDNYFNTTKAGQTLDWAGGQLLNNGDGTATWRGTGPTNSDRGTILKQSDYNFHDVAGASSTIGDFWKQQYGYDPAWDGYNISQNFSGSSNGAGSSVLDPASANSYWNNVAQQNGFTRSNPVVNPNPLPSTAFAPQQNNSLGTLYSNQPQPQTGGSSSVGLQQGGQTAANNNNRFFNPNTGTYQPVTASF